MEEKFIIEHADYDSECKFDFERNGDEITLKNIVNGGKQRYGIIVVNRINDELIYTSNIEGLEFINIKDSPFKKALTIFVETKLKKPL